jgi:hypothetical protein
VKMRICKYYMQRYLELFALFMFHYEALQRQI